MSEDESQDELVDDWNLPMEFHLFAKHETRILHLNKTRAELVSPDECDQPHENDGTTLQLECVDSLTPLDMMGLSSGLHDATGHCVWTGAFFFLAIIDPTAAASPLPDSSTAPPSNELRTCTTSTVYGDILSSVFHSKRVIELGSGTGIGGLALCKSTTCRPKLLCFTDADPDVLALCQRNCERNLRSRPSTGASRLRGNLTTTWRTVKLTWGQDPLPADVDDHSFEAVLATDVLYDIGLLPALLNTASACLVRGGNFCLSHVPRACYNSKHPPVDDLEAYIVDQAGRHGFELAHTIRPRDCQQPTSIPSSAFNYVRMHDLDQVGAAVLVFAAVNA